MKSKKKSLLAVAIATLALSGVATAATETVSITPNRLGSLVLEESTIEDATALFGEPTETEEIGDGCWTGMRRLRWGTDLSIVFYLDDDTHRVLQPVVKDGTLDLADGNQWRVETGRGLKIGDSKRRLVDLYPKAKNYGTRTYTLLIREGYKYQTATLDGDDRVKKLSAAVSC